MNFRPVTDTSAYDAETIELYQKRQSPDHLTASLMRLRRNFRNRLPVIASDESFPYQVAEARKVNAAPFWLFTGFVAWAFASN